MKIRYTLSLYIARQFLISLGIVMLAFSTLVVLLDVMELLRRGGDGHASSLVLIEMALLKYPLTGQKMLPFVMLIGTLLAYARLARRSELVVIRSAGISAWQFVFPAVMVAFITGILVIVAINPLGAIMIGQYERLEAKYFQSRSSILSLMPSGLWLRETNNPIRRADDPLQKNPVSEVIVHAREMGSRDNVNLQRVMVLMLGQNNIFLRRIDADYAQLIEGSWLLNNAVISEPDGTPERHEQYTLPTNVTMDDIQQSFASPETLSFWQLPDFINTLSKSGFSDLPHRMQWHTILVSPFLYVAMVYLAAVFCIHHSRQGTAGTLLTAGIFSGFLMYFMMNLVFSLGLSGNMPVPMAAWAPVILALLVGVGTLLHYEDG